MVCLKALVIEFEKICNDIHTSTTDRDCYGLCSFFYGINKYFFSFFPETAFEHYIKIVKIQLIVFITMMLITDIKRVKQMIWVIVLSIGYFSVKGGLFTLVTAESHMVWGPEGSFIGDNNAPAVAILMTIPLMIYLYHTATKKWIKYGLLVASTLSIFTVIGSQSRGAFLAITAVGLFYWNKSESKVLTGLLVVILSVGLLAFAPEAWYNRMNTIHSYEEDSSAMWRLNAWEYAYNAVNDNLLGVGLDSWEPGTFALYAPDPLDIHAAHSIYFSVLADHGWIGLFMFELIFFLSWTKLKSLIKRTAKKPDLHEINLLARMLHVSFIAYFVGGVFLSLSYFDLPWHLVSFVIILNGIVTTKNKTLYINKQSIKN